jgi:branched-chain amino acid transport system substrate-binding protein
MNRVEMKLRVVIAIVCCAGLALLVSACGGSGGSGSGEVASGGSSLACSKEPVSKPTGSPLTFGALVTKAPGIDLSPVAGGVHAYFECINEHGGLQGHPLKYIVEEEQINPQQASSEATKLIQNDHVVGMLGNISLVDCSVNGKTYEENGIYVIGVGTEAACYESKNFAATQAGPILAPQLAAQYLISKGATDSLVALATQIPGGGVYNSGAVAVAKQEGVKNVSGLLEPAPVTDPNSTALKLAEEAGENGGAVVALSPSENVKVLQAIEQQGLVEKTSWGCNGVCAEEDVAEALGPEWNEKLFIPADFPLLNSNLPEMKLFRGVMAKYGGGEKLGAFNEAGFVAARLVIQALEGLPDSKLNRAGINEAISGIRDEKTELLCEPWSYAKVSVTAGRIITVKDHKFVEVEGCTKIEPVTPQQKAAEAEIGNG